MWLLRKILGRIRLRGTEGSLLGVGGVEGLAERGGRARLLQGLVLRGGRSEGGRRCSAVELGAILGIIRIRLARLWGWLVGLGGGGELARAWRMLLVVMGRTRPAKDGFVCSVALVRFSGAHWPVHGGQRCRGRGRGRGRCRGDEQVGQSR